MRALSSDPPTGGAVTYFRLSPRLLRVHEAAAYFSIPVTQFERLGIGRACLGTKVRYDQRALDVYLDTISEISPPAVHFPSNDAEAALERFTARLPDPARRS